MSKAPKPKPEEAAPKPAGQDTPTGQDTPAVVAPTEAAQKLVDVLALQVVGPARGRWRIGRHFTQEVTVLLVEELTEEEVAALKADPVLAVIETKTTGAQPAA